jgi:glycosyltransferase involved in cell wall biosynthesis
VTHSSAAPKILISLVVPVHDEAGSIEPFLGRARPVLDEVTARFGPGVSFEIIMVDDGSTDSTLAELCAAREADPRIKILVLSRNFGKDTALAAGLAQVSGMAVVPIDVDLQDPPELIPAMVERWLAGYDLVNARRADRSADGLVKRRTAGAFYRIFNWLAERPIAPDTGDFRLISRPVVDIINQFPERARFTKGLFAWVGFSQCSIDYVRPARASGRTKWRYWRLWNFAIDGITSSTTMPLRVWTYCGAAVALLAFAYAIFMIARTLIFGIDVPGYASLMVLVLFFGGINLLSLGIIGEYLGRTYTEVKGRPLYIVKAAFGLGQDEPAAAGRDAVPEAAAEALRQMAARRYGR